MCDRYVLCALCLVLLVMVLILAIKLGKDKESYCVDISGKGKGGPGYSCGFECGQGAVCGWCTGGMYNFSLSNISSTVWTFTWNIKPRENTVFMKTMFAR